MLRLAGSRFAIGRTLMLGSGCTSKRHSDPYTDPDTSHNAIYPGHDLTRVLRDDF